VSQSSTDPRKQADSSERESIVLASDSMIGRWLDAVACSLATAWQLSSTRRWLLPGLDAWRLTRGAPRLRAVGAAALVAMATHVVLMLVDARAIEPLTFVVPAVVSAIAAVMIVMAAPLARWLERWR
jgi:hypothetical protein